MENELIRGAVSVCCLRLSRGHNSIWVAVFFSFLLTSELPFLEPPSLELCSHFWKNPGYHFMSFVAGHGSFQLLPLSLSTDWKPAGDYALMSCIYAELNISFGTTEERTGNQNSKLEYVSPFLTQKKKKSHNWYPQAGEHSDYQAACFIPTREEEEEGRRTKSCSILICVVYDPCCWSTASPNWLGAVMYFNNVRMLDGYSVTSKPGWIEPPTPRLALFLALELNF